MPLCPVGWSMSTRQVPKLIPSKDIGNQLADDTMFGAPCPVFDQVARILDWHAGDRWPFVTWQGYLWDFADALTWHMQDLQS